MKTPKASRPSTLSRNRLKFIRLAEKRINKVAKQLQLIGNLSNKTNYAYSDEEVEKMFTLFVSKKGSRGTGLGLSVSQKICKEHGGQIIVESEPGQGSRFALEIPTVFPPEGAAPPSGDGSSICEPQPT